MPFEGRPSGRKPDALRAVTLETGVNRYAEGSCLISFGHTRVLVTATVEESLPPWLRNKGQGWVTAEYGMLPRATHTRGRREAAQGKQSGRTQEIQRLIGRSLRAVVDLKALGERQITLDCDVVQADGGTRTAAITGAWVALAQAVRYLRTEEVIKTDPILDQVAAISCGVFEGRPVLDLDYEEDSNAEADSNFVLTGKGDIVEIQATGEKRGFSRAEFDELFGLAQFGCSELFALQRAAMA
ncbi:MAG TPA: ribonuclease PH [Caulobacteraceae bacterium]|jgi:ribonuclease PH